VYGGADVATGSVEASGWLVSVDGAVVFEDPGLEG